jgi:hypothetical protein
MFLQFMLSVHGQSLSLLAPGAKKKTYVTNSYRAVNTLRLVYKSKSVNAVPGNYLFRLI